MLCRAQSPAFEVASVKLNLSGGNPQLRNEPGRLNISNMTLKALMRYAYTARDFQISGGPAWFDSDRWDVIATAPSGAGDDERRRMLQSLLAERFRLTLHRETREMPVYALVVGKNGPKLKANKDGRPQELKQGMIVRNGALFQLHGVDASVSSLADFLSQQVGRVVSNRTGVAGRFDFTLEWAPDPAQTPSLNGARMEPSTEGQSLFTAVQQQLGLKLESTKGPVEVFVVERAEKATEN